MVDAIAERLIRIELLLEDTRRQTQVLAERFCVLQRTMTVESRSGRSQIAEGFGLFGRAPGQGHDC